MIFMFEYVEKNLFFYLSYFFLKNIFFLLVKKQKRWDGFWIGKNVVNVHHYHPTIFFFFPLTNFILRMVTFFIYNFHISLPILQILYLSSNLNSFILFNLSFFFYFGESNLKKNIYCKRSFTKF